MKKPIQSKIEYILFLIFYHTIRILPFSVIKFVAAQLMIFGGMVLGIRKETAEKNLRMVYPKMFIT